jgi:mono/diheme cytochrome c family protein
MQDKETGIGGWTDAEIVALLKDGSTPDFDYVGSGMAEVVRNSTGRLTDDDRKAIVAYLRTVPPLPGPPKKK